MTTVKYEIELPELPEEIRDTHELVFWMKLPTQVEAAGAYGLLLNGQWEKAHGELWRGVAAVPKSKPWTLADEIGRPMPFAVRTREGRKAYVVGYTRPMLEEYPWCIRYPEDIDGDAMFCVDISGRCISPSLEYRRDVVGLWEET